MYTPTNTTEGSVMYNGLEVGTYDPTTHTYSILHKKKDSTNLITNLSMQFEKDTVRRLKNVATALNVHGRSKMKKKDLVDYFKEHITFQTLVADPGTDASNTTYPKYVYSIERIELWNAVTLDDMSDDVFIDPNKIVELANGWKNKPCAGETFRPVSVKDLEELDESEFFVVLDDERFQTVIYKRKLL